MTFSFLVFQTPSLAANSLTPSDSCAELLERSVEKITSRETDPNRAKQIQQLLLSKKSKILDRVRKVCPEGGQCPPATLAHAVTSAIEEELAEIEAPTVKIGWRVWLTVSASVLTYMTASTAAQTFLPSMTATMTVAFLTYFGTYALDAIGAPVLEYLLPPLRRWMYSTNKLALARDLDRNGSQQRHRVIYMLGQELISQTEGLGRTTDTEVVLRLVNALTACSAGNSVCQTARDRAAEIIAKLVSHLVKQYPEIDLRDSDYAEWVHALFGKWNVSPSQQAEFVDQVMGRIENQYDLTARSSGLRQRKYLSILRSWFALDIPEAETNLVEGAGI